MDILSLYYKLGALLGFQIFIFISTVGGANQYNLKVTYDRGRVIATWDAVQEASEYTVRKFYGNTDFITQITTNTNIELKNSTGKIDKITMYAKVRNRSTQQSKYVYLPKTVFSEAGKDVSIDMEYKTEATNLIKNKDKDKILFHISYNKANPRVNNYNGNVTTAGTQGEKAKLSLIIKNVQMEDAGYIVGYLDNEEETTSGVMLIVLGVPTPKISGPQEEQIGEDANLTCLMPFSYKPDYFEFEKDIIYTWFRNTSTLQRERRNVLMINNRSYRDNAYYCLVEIIVNRGLFQTTSIKSDPFIFQNTSPALITGVCINDMEKVTKGETVNVTMGQSVSVICYASGYPHPDISWARNGEEVSGMKVTQNTAQLNITNASCGEFLNYSCEASNKHGKDESYFTLAVLCPPEILNFKGNYEVDLPKRLMISYKVRSNPQPTVKVTFNNTAVSSYDVIMDLLSPSMYKMSLNMEVQYEKYSLMLSNTIGNNTYAIKVSSTDRTTDSSSAEVNGPFNISLIAILAGSVGILIIVVVIVTLILKRQISKRGNDRAPVIIVQESSNDLYASVNKPSKAEKTRDIKPEVPEDAAAAVSKDNEVGTSSDPSASGRRTNPDGLIYIDVAFKEAPKKVSEHPVIHGNDDKTIYTTVSLIQDGATSHRDSD